MKRLGFRRRRHPQHVQTARSHARRERRGLNQAFFAELHLDREGVKRAILNPPFAQLIDRTIVLAEPEDDGEGPEDPAGRPDNPDRRRGVGHSSAPCGDSARCEPVARPRPRCKLSNFLRTRSAMSSSSSGWGSSGSITKLSIMASKAIPKRLARSSGRVPAAW